MVAASLSLTAGAGTARLAFLGYAGGSTPLQDFQALVRLSEGKYGFSYKECSAENGGDLWFEDSSGNVLPREIDTWNENGYSFVWVRVPQVTSSTWIKMHWGETPDTTTVAASSANVWRKATPSGTGYIGVWHMGNASGSANEPDATGNGLDAVPNGWKSTGGTLWSGNLSQMTTIAYTTPENVSNSGYTGGSRVNSTGAVNGLLVPDYTSKDENDFLCKKDSVFTVSGWFYRTGSYNYGRLVSARLGNGTLGSERQGWSIAQGDQPDGTKAKNILQFGYKTAACNQNLALNPSLQGNWWYLTAVYNGSEYIMYGNGVELKRTSGLQVCSAPSTLYGDLGLDIMWGFAIGCAGVNGQFVGKYDEVRFYEGVESPERIKANYDTMKAPDSFLVKIDDNAARATWTGAVDGDPAKPGNWICYNISGETVEGAVPAEGTVVTIPCGNLSVAPSAAFAAASIAIAGGELPADADLSVLGDGIVFETGAIVDLKGRNLAIAGFGSNSAMITNSVDGTVSTLEVKVASAGDTMENAAVRIGGNIKLVKSGAGTFVPSFTPQTYTAGTTIAAGTVKAAANGHPNRALGRWSGNGFTKEGSEYYNQFTETVDYTTVPPVEILAQGTLDFNGFSGWTVYHYVLDGGTITDSVGLSSDNTSQFGSTKLLSDSTWNAANKMQCWVDHTTDLNGNTLTVRIGSGKQLTIGNNSVDKNIDYRTHYHIITNGVFDVVSGGMLKTVSRVDARTVEFRQRCALSIGQEMTVSNYVARLNQNNANEGGAALKVYGSFRPEVKYFYGPTMQEGSTLDFSAWAATGAGWPVASQSLGTASYREIKFASGVRKVGVKVDSDSLRTLAKTKDGSGAAAGYVLKWGSAGRPAGAAFSLVSNETGRYKIAADDTGVRVFFTPGLAVVIR